MYNNNFISVIIPAYNEERSIGPVLQAVPDFVDQVIVVDNSSTDQTAAVARAHKAQVAYEPQKGYGISCQTGIQLADKADIIVILDADFSDYPEKMQLLVGPIASGRYDLVLSSRVLGRCEPGALTPQQRWGNALACWLMRAFCGYRFTDMGPFRAVRKSALDDLQMRDRDYGWNVEMQMKAVRQKLRLKEVAVDYRCRIGQSKISGTLSGTIKAGYKIIITIFYYGLVSR